jgi:6,7-dimethyl-8-ribityllumazine synthase
MMKKFEGAKTGDGLKIAIVATRWNADIVDRLADGAKEALLSCGVAEDAIHLAMAPGAFEVPFVARKLAETGHYHGIVALGCVIRGETAHFDYVAGEAARGVAAAAHDTGVPISFGVLTVDTMEQAMARAGGKKGDKGAEAALALLETVNLCREIEEF